MGMVERTYINKGEVENFGGSTFLRRSRASGVRYGGSTSFPLRILSMVFLRFSAVNGGCGGHRGAMKSQVGQEGSGSSPQPPRDAPPIPTEGGRSSSGTCRSGEHVVHQGAQAPPVHRPVVPAAHQDLGGPGGFRGGPERVGGQHRPPKLPPVLHPPHMYSMVPQKVWVTAPSWMDSLHSPKSVSLM